MIRSLPHLFAFAALLSGSDVVVAAPEERTPLFSRHVGAVFGLMNGMGVFGAMASQGFVGVFVEWQKSRGLSGREQWDPLFDVYVVVLLCGAATWWLYRYTPLEGRTNSSAAPPPA